MQVFHVEEFAEILDIHRISALFDRADGRVHNQEYAASKAAMNSIIDPVGKVRIILDARCEAHSRIMVDLFQGTIDPLNRRCPREWL